MKSKRCIVCEKRKLITQFGKFKDKRSGKIYVYSWCKKCDKIWHKEYRFINRKDIKMSKDLWYKNNKERVIKHRKEDQRKFPEKWFKGQRKRTLKYKYGLTLEQFKQMLKDQHGRCAICGCKFSTKNRACVDHCHKTGKVRGLLCQRCNRSLGGLEGYLMQAIKYLKVNK